MSQLSPSQALTVNEGYSFSQEDPVRLGIPVTRHFDNGKTRPGKPPDAPTIPIGAAHISFSGQHRISQATSKTRLQVSPRWPRGLLSSYQHLEKHWPGGAKIKMTLGLITPKGNVGGGEANGKIKVGPCWRSFIQSKLSRGPHNTQPHKECKIKEHNTSMTETRAARVEQNTRHKAEPSTLYLLYRCININKRYCDIPTYPCSKHGTNSIFTCN